MKLVFQLVAVHLAVAIFAYSFVGNIWGNSAEKTYDARMRWGGRFLMPGRLADKAYWIKYQKRLSILMLPAILLFYVGVMVSILKASPAAP